MVFEQIWSENGNTFLTFWSQITLQTTSGFTSILLYWLTKNPATRSAEFKVCTMYLVSWIIAVSMTKMTFVRYVSVYIYCLQLLDCDLAASTYRPSIFTWLNIHSRYAGSCVNCCCKWLWSQWPSISISCMMAIIISSVVYDPILQIKWSWNVIIIRILIQHILYFRLWINRKHGSKARFQGDYYINYIAQVEMVNNSTVPAIVGWCDYMSPPL